MKDGLDIALYSLNLNTNILEYSGAYNPLYLLRNKEVLIKKETRRPVGSFIKDKKNEFENHTKQLQKDDIVYIFTDGIADQFGGENSEKFGYKKLRNILIENSEIEVDKQIKISSSNIENWMIDSNEDQLDYICLFAVKI